MTIKDMGVNDIYKVAESGTMREFFSNLTIETREAVVAEIFSSLVGTSMDTPGGTLEEFGLSFEMLEEFGIPESKAITILDSEAITCDDCGWWFSPKEGYFIRNDSNLCGDCSYEEDYEDEEEDDLDE